MWSQRPKRKAGGNSESEGMTLSPDKWLKFVGFIMKYMLSQSVSIREGIPSLWDCVTGKKPWGEYGDNTEAR